MKDNNTYRGLHLYEWTMIVYACATLLLMLIVWPRLFEPWPMLWGRIGAVAATVALWGISLRFPGRLIELLRVALQLILLSWWYPDTYELNRILPSLDHLFASAEQWLFGCQPALVFAMEWPQHIVSELLALGYVSYYPLFSAMLLAYFFLDYRRFSEAAFILLGSFFVFYVIFIALPVVGPQFYYAAVGTEQIANAQFPAMSHYFATHQESLPIPGWHDGTFYKLLVAAHNAGERPTAAFPSSHVGVTVVALWQVWHSKFRWLLWPFVPLAVLMFFATFYIQAHYAIDAIAGVLAGTAIYFALRAVYGKLRSHYQLRQH